MFKIILEFSKNFPAETDFVQQEPRVKIQKLISFEIVF
jgi:hypothetical protein